MSNPAVKLGILTWAFKEIFLGHLRNCNSVYSCWPHFSALKVATLNAFFFKHIDKIIFK